jgi:hypothetical protein
MVVHLNDEALSELLDGDGVAATKEHLASCESCQRELQALGNVRLALRELPELEPPGDLWARIESRLPVPSRTRRSRLRWPGLIALQAAAMAAVFVLGLGLGRFFEPGQSGGSEAVVAQRPVAETASAGSLAEALAEVRRRGAEYDAALRDLERLARQEGAPVGSLAEQRLASLNLLVEASRTALTADPADPVLNAYLFAALEERDEVMRQMGTDPEDGSNVYWR